MTTTAPREDDNESSSGGGSADKPNISMETKQASSSGRAKKARKKESKEESAESSSTGSSEGKSGSGGGYSADCSASDQSSDENGDRKETSSNLDLDVGGLTIHDRAASRSNNSSDEVVSCGLNDADGKPQSNDKRTADARKNDGEGKEHKDANSLGIELPMKSPDTIDLESIMRSKTEEERESVAVLQDHRVLPQWNGVRVAHPMDLRTDLSTVTVLQAGVVPGPFQSMAEQQQEQQLESTMQPEEASAPFSVDNYSQLLEVSEHCDLICKLGQSPTQISLSNRSFALSSNLTGSFGSKHTTRQTLCSEKSLLRIK